ncbi:hypothetical protein [Microbulbifer sp. S227A]|uniref:hypothetical protein n=1 Tax=Microbulbifer sp. S227A TaxID=3415131 RepID=UPI003C7D44CB
MAEPDRKPRPQFSQPVRQILMMLTALGLSGFGVFVALPRVLPVFQANPYLNGFILIVFVVGVLATFYQVLQLIGSVRWIERFAAGQVDSATRPPQLLAPLASLLRARGARMQLSSSSTRSILDSVATRIDEERDITRYIVNLLIFLGLLGTFYGLATTVPAVVETIRSLAPQEGEQGLDVFNRLMTGLEKQLGGMGVAFASSLLGLAGSLIVGLLELFAGHGQNRFYRELEEWLSSITRVGFSSGDDGSTDSGSAPGVPAHMTGQMDGLYRLIERAEAGRAEIDRKLATVLDRMMQQDPSDRIATALDRLAAGQDALNDTLREQAGDGIDAESRMRLRSIDVQMLRILEEISAGRQESLAELRKDIELLAKALDRPRGDGRRPKADGESGEV